MRAPADPSPTTTGGASAALLAACALILAVGCSGSPVPESIHAVGVAPYAPIPSDALPIRQADRAAYERLTQAVQGLRYTRAGGEFVLAGAAFAGAQPTERDIEEREVIQIGRHRIFWVTAHADALGSLPEQALDELADAHRIIDRFEIRIRAPQPTPPGDPSAAADPSVAAQVQAGVDRSIQRALVRLYTGQTIPSHGRVFLVDVRPEWELADQRIPRDPTGDANPALTEAVDGYREGRLYRSPFFDRLIIEATVLILPDIPLADR